MTRKLFFKMLPVVSALVVLLAGCPAPLGTGGTDGSKSVVAKDASGVVLGYVTESNALGLTVFTSKNYFVELNWDGSLVVPYFGAPFCYFTGANGTGTAFVLETPTQEVISALAISVIGQVYVTTVDANGLALTDGTITASASFFDVISNSIINSGSSIYAGAKAVPLKTATIASIGLPATIALPMQLVSQ